MRATEWVKYLFGHRRAIEELARWREGLWVGAILVLLTGFARNYDQTFITENPVMWLLGPLLFSFVSGWWLYVVLYGFCARRGMEGTDGAKPPFWSGWRSFMGLFWMTAPIAWLYAIPVERFADSVTSVKLNLVLLAVVSLWRVLLMARVMQVVTVAPFFMTLGWVTFAAAVEVCVMFFFGGGFGRAIMAAMGGMRNSPEEEIIVSAMETAFGVAFWTVPIALVFTLLLRTRRKLTPFPETQSRPIPWRTIAALAVFWVTVSILPQRELANSLAVERLIADRNARGALDYCAKHQPGDFAPAKVLPPKPYEWEFFEQLPACFDAVQATDPPWVRSHLMHRLDQLCLHYTPRWSRRRTWASYTSEEQITNIVDGVQWLGPEAGDMLKLLGGLQRIPEGKEWLKTNVIFLEGMQAAAKEMRSTYRSRDKSEEAQKADWLVLSNQLQFLQTTNWRD